MMRTFHEFFSIRDEECRITIPLSKNEKVNFPSLELAIYIVRPKTICDGVPVPSKGTNQYFLEKSHKLRQNITNLRELEDQELGIKGDFVQWNAQNAIMIAGMPYIKSAWADISYEDKYHLELSIKWSCPPINHGIDEYTIEVYFHTEMNSNE